MEENLNQATGQFSRDDYTSYTRCVHIAWQGDWGTLNYLDATRHADLAAPKVAAVLRQLHAAGLQLNVIAHSLGNRVLLGALNQLGADSAGVVDHCFMWEAAVSELALSPEPKPDAGTVTHHFPNAMNATNHVTVLYNQYDTVLAVPYWLAVYTGVDVTGQFVTFMAELGVVVGTKDTAKFMYPLFAELIKQFEAILIAQYDPTYPEAAARLATLFKADGFVDMLYHWSLAYFLHSDDDKAVREHMRIVNPILQRYAEQFNCHQALGLVGDLHNKKEFQNIPKVKFANMSPYATGHSYMHILTKAVMDHGYETYIINANAGVNSFGHYVKSAFPHFPIPEDETDTVEQ